MAGAIIWYITMGFCAVLFLSIGIYSYKLKKPMWFWSGSTVLPEEITDVKAYNEANGKMWITYSLWYFASAIAEIWSSGVALALLIASCTVGMVILVVTYDRIYKKYSTKR